MDTLARVKALIGDALNRPAGDIDADATLTDLGLDHLAGINLGLAIAEHFDITIPADDLDKPEMGTAQGIADYVLARLLTLDSERVDVQAHDRRATRAMAARNPLPYTFTVSNGVVGELLRITPEGDVIAPTLEAANEAGRVFVESIRHMLGGSDTRTHSDVSAVDDESGPSLRELIDAEPALIDRGRSLGIEIEDAPLPPEAVVVKPPLPDTLYITTGDPRFDPHGPVIINGYEFKPA